MWGMQPWGKNRLKVENQCLVSLTLTPEGKQYNSISERRRILLRKFMALFKQNFKNMFRE